MDAKEIHLQTFKVEKSPPTIYYIPDFISNEEESDILKNVYSVPKPKWTYLSNRRLQDYGGVPHEKGMIPEKIPVWLQKYMNKVNTLGVFDGNLSNQVLVNEYLPGQGIMPHTDGPLFFPTVTTITCGAHTILEFSENTVERKKVGDILLEKRSLVIVKDDMYSKYLHSISERTCDMISANIVNCHKYSLNDSLPRDTRVSVTIRHVPKVLKLKLWKI